MNEMVQYHESRALTAADMRAQVNLVQEVMKAVMQGPSKDNPTGVHYGTIPGTPKPTLYKAGAEVLAATFRIAVSYKVDDLSTPDAVRYRVTATGTHQTTGIVMGAGMGECSSGEEKYKWRKASSTKEFEATTEDRRRVKYGYNAKTQTEYEIKQVRTEAADLANTVLKMACKRAQVAMILNVTAASDIFAQDIEDLPEELRPHEEGAPKPKDSGPPPYADADFQADLPKFTKLIKAGKKTPDQVIAMVSTKVIPTEAQKKTLREIKKDGEPAETPAAPGVTFAAVAERLQKATDPDVLDADADLIRSIGDAGQREELTAIYHKRQAELEVTQ